MSYHSDDIEIIAIALKEWETAIFHSRAEFAAVAKVHGYARHLAHIWGCSTNLVNTLARVHETFPKELITPDQPLSLYRAALDAADATDESAETWLERAIDNEWSSRQLRDAADVAKGRHTSRVPLLDGDEAEVLLWQPAADGGMNIGLHIPDRMPSGESPARVRVRAWEVLDASG